MKLNRRTVILAAVFLAVISCALFFGRSFVRDAIVLPLSYWVFLLRILVQKLPQGYFWVIVLVISAVVAWRSFLSERKRVEREPMVPDIGPGQGRVEYWAARVNLIRLGAYYQSTFNESIGRLALDLLAYRNRLSIRQIDRGLNTGELQVPGEVRDFLLKNVLRRDFAPVPFWEYLYRVIRMNIMSSMRLSRMRRQDLETGPSKLLDYMEEELEVRHDNTGQ